MTLNEEERIVSTAMEPRFTVDGSDDLESCLSQLCADIADSVQKLIPQGCLEALLLGGGYGRGEGGVLRTPAGEDALYNDLEFYLLLKGPPALNEYRYGAAIQDLAHKFSAEAGVEVEIKILSVAKL